MIIPLILLTAYLVGSIPTGYWFARCFFNLDITQHGSGNIGATNVARVLGNKAYFVLILAIDAAKSYGLLKGAAWLLQRNHISSTDAGLVLYGAALALLLGNGYSIFLRFRGGKGVATLAGILLFFVVGWQVAVAFMTWTIQLAYTRKMFWASLMASLVVTGAHWMVYGSDQLGLGLLLSTASLWLIYRHRSNLLQWWAEQRKL